MALDELVIETAKTSDLEQLVALDARSFSEADRYIRSEWQALLQQSLEGNALAIFVARIGPELVGAIVTEWDVPAKDLNVVSVSVDSKVRRLGVATRLLRRALADIPDEVQTVSLEVRPENNGARNFYRDLGFKVTGKVREYYLDGGDALEYRALRSGLRKQLAT